MGKIFLMLSSFCMLWACSVNKYREERSFVKNYGNESFSEFRNFSLTLRGVDNSGNKIVLVYDTLDCGFLRVLVDKNSLDTISTAFIKTKENCMTNMADFDLSVIRKFLNFHINYLRVDSTNNVFVKVQNSEGTPNLMQVNDTTLLSNIDMSNWEIIQDNWYVSNRK